MNYYLTFAKALFDVKRKSIKQTYKAVYGLTRDRLIKQAVKKAIKTGKFVELQLAHGNVTACPCGCVVGFHEGSWAFRVPGDYCKRHEGRIL